MLSATHEINDMVDRLDIPNTYGYIDEDEMKAALTTFIEDAMNDYMLPAIGSSRYNTIAAKDKTDLTDTETYLYNAEVWFSIAMFLTTMGEHRTQKKDSTSVTYSQAGVNKTYSGPNGMITSAGNYKNRAMKQMNNAGYYYTRSISRNGLMGEWKWMPSV